MSLRSRLLDKIPYFQNVRDIPLDDIRDVAITVTAGTNQAVEPLRDWFSLAYRNTSPAHPRRF